VREWVVGSAVIESPAGILLVANRRRNGRLDWSPPGGVIEVHEGESVLDGLTREVEEETGLRVTEWAGPLYEVDALAPDLGWHLRAEIHRAVAYEGTLRVDDPDGIVIDAQFVPIAACAVHLDGCHPWVREPLGEWLGERWDGSRPYGYRVEGADPATIVVHRVS
jgi:8-oxo-dGTP diphosphatase